MTNKNEKFIKGNNMVLAGIMGLAIGDALGVPVEFTSREYLRNNPVKEMMGYGTYNQPAGSWSDDTSLTLGLLDSLGKEGYSINDIAHNFLSWYMLAEYTPNGVVFDIGNATREALIRIGQGEEPLKAGGKTEYDNGNGSLMRILPLAFYLKDEDNIEERIRKIYEVSSITHGHIRSKMACHIYVEMAIKLIKGATLEESYLETINEIKDYYKEEKELATFKRILSGDINRLNEDAIKSSGYVIDTLEAALWCLFTTSSYKEAVLKAVNLGSDTDTVAAVTGGLSGIYYGIESIPEEWIQVIINKELIYELSEALNKKLLEKE